MEKTNFTSVDEYISTFSGEIKEKLQEIRKCIQEVVPEAKEIISYQMPAYKKNGILVYFAGFKNHIGFFPTGSGVARFLDELNDYKTSKGTIQFPLNQGLPLDLIRRITIFREQEDSMKSKKKSKD